MPHAGTHCCRKYASFAQDYNIVPLAFETLGSLGTITEAFLSDLAKRIRLAKGDTRAGKYFLERLSLSLQRGNALAVMGTMGARAQEELRRVTF